MGILVNGNKPSKIIYNGAETALYFNGSKIWPEASPAPTFDEVTIGSQTWMSKNLAINDGQGGIYNQTVNYGQENVVEYYYTWDAAVRVAASITGWHLPSKDEWTALINTVGGTAEAFSKLKSTYGWNSSVGTDNYGFTVLPAGWYSDGSFGDLTTYAGFFTSSTYSSSKVYFFYMLDTGNGFYNSTGSKTFCRSIRLIKDS